MAELKTESGKHRENFGFWPFLFAIAGLVLSAAPGALAGTTLQQSVLVNRAAGEAMFSISFDHAPDFNTLSAQGVPVDSFQYEINGAWQPGQPLFQQFTTIVRGIEIHFDGTLPIRAGGPSDPSDRSGGWGPIVDSVPFSLVGNKVTFAVPLSVLGAPSGVFSYDAFTLAGGAATAEVTGAVVSLPSALGATLLMMLSCGAIAGLRAIALQKRVPVRIASWNAKSLVQRHRQIGL